MSALTGSEVKRAWRIVTWAGLLGSIYYVSCITGAPRIKYLTELGATAFDFGLIAGLGSIVIVFQLLGSLMISKVTRRKPVWIALLICHRLVFSLVLLAPLLFTETKGQIAWILVVLFIHDALAQTGVPLWFSWMADLVPAGAMTRHWATRQRFVTMVNIVFMIAVAFGFHWFEMSGRIVLGFSILAAIGVVIGVIDILLFIKVPEPDGERPVGGRPIDTILQPVRDQSFRPFLLFMGYWYFAIFVAAPFFDLYMLERLKLSVLTVQLIATVSAVGVVVSSHFWGLLCDSFGFRPVLQFLALFKAMAPLVFMLIPTNPALGVPILFGFIFFDGICNAGTVLAVQGPLLKSTPRRNRAMYIAAANFFSIGIMATIAPILGGKMIEVFDRNALALPGGLEVDGFHSVFALSMILRLGAFVFASKIRESGSIPLRVVLKHIFSTQSFTVTRLARHLCESRVTAKRLAAARQLGTLRNPLAMSELIYSLHDDDKTVRHACVDALGEIGASEAVEPLAEALFDGESGVQSPAARALGRIGGVNSLRALLNNLSNLNSEALGDTIESLAKMNNDAAVVPLVALFNEVEDEAVRRKITEALSSLMEIRPVEDVAHLLMGRRPLDQQLFK